MLLHIINENQLSIHQYYTQGIVFNLIKRFEQTFEMILEETEDFDVAMEEQKDIS